MSRSILYTCLTILTILTGQIASCRPNYVDITVYENGLVMLTADLMIRLDDLFAGDLAGSCEARLSIFAYRQDELLITGLIKGGLTSLPNTPWDFETVELCLGEEVLGDLQFTAYRNISSYYEIISLRAKSVGDGIYVTNSSLGIRDRYMDLSIVLGYRNDTVDLKDLEERALEIGRIGVPAVKEIFHERNVTGLAVNITGLADVGVRPVGRFYELYIRADAVVSLRPGDYPESLADTVETLNQIITCGTIRMYINWRLDAATGDFSIVLLPIMILGDMRIVLPKAQQLFAELIRCLSRRSELVVVRPPISLKPTRKAASAAHYLLNLTLAPLQVDERMVIEFKLSQGSPTSSAEGRLRLGPLYEKPIVFLSPNGINGTSKVLGAIGRGLALLAADDLNVTLRVSSSGKTVFSLPDRPKPSYVGETVVEWRGLEILTRLGEVRITLVMSEEEAATGGGEKEGEGWSRSTAVMWLAVLAVAVTIAVFMLLYYRVKRL